MQRSCGSLSVHQVAVVLRQEDTLPRLAVYVVWHEPPDDCMVKQVHNTFWAMLPDCPLPTTLITMDRLPYGRNHKIDYEALPEALDVGINSDATLMRPLNTVQAKIQGYAQEVRTLHRPPDLTEAPLWH